MKKRGIRKLMATLLVTGTLLSAGMTAFAAESSVDKATEEATVADVVTEEAMARLEARSASGYAAHYTDSLIGSFSISVTGSSSSSATVRIKAWDFQNNPDVYATLYRPDGSVAVSDVRLPIGTEVTKYFSNLPTGNYRLSYHVFGVNKGWIYCNITSR